MVTEKTTCAPRTCGSLSPSQPSGPVPGRCAEPAGRLWQPRRRRPCLQHAPCLVHAALPSTPTPWVWDGPDADYTPRSDDLPWCMVPEKKLTPEDVKVRAVLPLPGHALRPLRQLRRQEPAQACLPLHRHQPQRLYGPAAACVPTSPEESRAIEWVAYASNALNTMVPFYANVDHHPGVPVPTPPARCPPTASTGPAA